MQDEGFYNSDIAADDGTTNNFVKSYIGTSSIVTGIVISYTIWRFTIRWYLQQKKPYSFIPIANYCHWFWGHEPILILTSNFWKGYYEHDNHHDRDHKLHRHGSKRASRKQPNHDFRDVQRILGIDSANPFGQTSFWIRNIPFVSITHWEDLQSILNDTTSSSRFHYPNNQLLKNTFIWKSNNKNIDFRISAAISLEEFYDHFSFARLQKSLQDALLNKTDVLDTDNVQAYQLYKEGTICFLSKADTRTCIDKTINETLVNVCHTLRSKLEISHKLDENAKGKTSPNMKILGSSLSHQDYQCDCVQLIRYMSVEIFCHTYFAQSADCDFAEFRSNVLQTMHIIHTNDITKDSSIAQACWSLLELHSVSNNFHHDRHNQILSASSLIAIQQFIQRRIRERRNDTDYLLKSDCPSPSITQKLQPRQNQPRSYIPKTDGLSSIIEYYSEKFHTQNIAGNRGDSFPTSTLSNYLIDTMFQAVNNTTSTLSYALYVVSQFPSIERLCLEEIQRATHNSSQRQNNITIDQLQYCKAVILETLRVFPPSISTMQKLSKPVKVRCQIPNNKSVETRRTGILDTNTYVFIPIWSIHRCKHNFPRPEEFRPDRWVMRHQHPSKSTIWNSASRYDCQSHARSDHRDDESYSGWMFRPLTDNSSGIPAANHKAFIPFCGLSPVEQNYMIETNTLILAHLLHNFQFDMIEQYTLRPESILGVQYPKGGMPLHISIRRRTTV